MRANFRGIRIRPALIHHKGHKGHKGSVQLQLGLGAVDHTTDTLPKMWDVEINQQTELVATEFQVRKKLRDMDW
jgi:hypothetical protein